MSTVNDYPTWPPRNPLVERKGRLWIVAPDYATFARMCHNKGVKCSEAIPLTYVCDYAVINSYGWGRHDQIIVHPDSFEPERFLRLLMKKDMPLTDELVHFRPKIDKLDYDEALMRQKWASDAPQGALSG